MPQPLRRSSVPAPGAAGRKPLPGRLPGAELFVRIRAAAEAAARRVLASAGRSVCNHPELFEGAGVAAAVALGLPEDVIAPEVAAAAGAEAGLEIWRRLCQS